MIETYANGDEALFADASLPRDDYGFRISNGISTRQQDLRTANSGITMAEFVAYSERTATSGSHTTTINLSRFSQSEENKTLIKLGNPYCVLSGENVEITKAGTYIVQVAGAFYISGFYPYSEGTQTYGAGLRLGLMQKTKSGWQYLCLQDGRQINFGSIPTNMTFTHVCYFDKGDILNVGFNWNMKTTSSTSGVSYTCQTTINLNRLS